MSLPVDVPTWVRPNPSVIAGGVVPSAAGAADAGVTMATAATATIHAITARHQWVRLFTACPLVLLVGLFFARHAP